MGERIEENWGFSARKSSQRNVLHENVSNRRRCIMTPIEMRNAKFGPIVAKNLTNRGFEAVYMATKEEALAQALAWIPADAVVAWGGSVSAQQIGLMDEVKSGKYNVIDRDKAANPAEKVELMRKSLLCDVYLTGSNAISQDGQLVNVDGNGNRVAAITYGPKNVIVIAGMNKVVPTVEDALTRARTEAAPINMQRFVNENTSTVCAKTGMCGNCNSPDCICNDIVITRRCKPAGRIKVVLVGEELGF